MARARRIPAGNPVNLTTSERKLVEDLRSRLSSIMQRLRSNEDVKSREIDEMGDVARELHVSLKKHGHEPKHTKVMRQNREHPPTHADFYRHVHPVEDLLRFVENERANDDPEDKTIGQSFELSIYSRRWGHDDNYRATRTASGWIFGHMQDVSTGRDGRVAGKNGTGLYQLLDHDSINYPEELPGYIEWLWEQAAESGLDHTEVKEALVQLADWISLCERHSPGGIFKGYK